MSTSDGKRIELQHPALRRKRQRREKRRNVKSVRSVSVLRKKRNYKTSHQKLISLTMKTYSNQRKFRIQQKQLARVSSIL